MVDDLAASFIPYLPVELREISWRAFPLDGKLLLFDRDSGLNVLIEDDETGLMQQVAPRTLSQSLIPATGPVPSVTETGRPAAYGIMRHWCNSAGMQMPGGYWKWPLGAANRCSFHTGMI